MSKAEGYTAKEIAEALGKVKTTIIRRAEKEGWPYENGKNRAKRYRLGGLPSDVQKVLVSRMAVSMDILPALAPEAALEAARRLTPQFDVHAPAKACSITKVWPEDASISADVVRDPKVAKWARIVQEAAEVPKGWKKRAWIEAVAVKHGTSFQTIYRYINKYRKKGLAGLQHTKCSRKKPKAWTPEAVDWWVGLVLKREHRKIGKHVLYAILEEEARKRGWQIGGYRSALWWLQKNATPQLLALQRGGTRALDNTLPPVLRDYSDLQPFEILVGDQHRFDFWVVDEESGEVFRPEGYFWQDLRTRNFYGAALDRKYDSYLMGLALRMGLRIFGPFDAIYTDHGKPEESRYIMGITKDMRTLGLQADRTVDVPLDLGGGDPEEINPCALMPGTHRKAIVRNAKAKMIEGTFNVLEGILRNEFKVPGYVKKLGGSQEENEVDQKEMERLARSGKLLTFREFLLTVLRAMDFYNSRKPHRGVLREWAWRPKPKAATPMDCLTACCLQGWRPVYLSEQAVDLIFLARSNRPRVVDRGRLTFRTEVYEHEKLIDLHKEKVELRFDPMDPDWVLVFHKGAFVCQASPVEYSSMKDTDLAARKIEEKRRRRKGFILEYRSLTSAVPDFREYSKTPAIERAAAAITKEQRTRRRQLEEHYRVREPEELAAGIAKIENYAPQERRPIFTSEVDRYRWCLDRFAEGLELATEDEAFMQEYESRMTAETSEYWATYKEALEAGGV